MGCTNKREESKTFESNMVEVSQNVKKKGGRVAEVVQAKRSS